MFTNARKLRLFRGDNEEIDEFDFSKTQKGCLVGQGIYLTNKEVVADSYRTKQKPGKYRRYDTPVMKPIEIIFDSVAKDRNDAIEKSFERFFLLHEPRSGYNGLKQHEKKKRMEEVRALFHQCRLEGRITAEYTSASSGVDGSRYLRVKYETNHYVGQVAVFEFPEKEFNDSMLDIYQITDPDILGLFFDAGISYGTPYETRDDYVRNNLWNRWGRTGYNGPRPDFAKVRRLIEPFGFRGFEYPGGMHIGGYGRHRAFCVWHDDWVNRHKVAVKR